MRVIVEPIDQARIPDQPRSRARHDSRHSYYLLSVLICLFPITVQAKDPTPEELLKAYEASISIYERAAFTVETNIYSPGWALPRGTPTKHSVYRVWRDGHRWKYELSDTTNSPDKRKILTSRYQSEKLFPGKGTIHVDLEPTRGTIQSVSARLGELSQAERSQIPAYWFGAIYGYLDNNGGVLLPQILKESKLSARKNKLEGRELWVLEGIGRWGYHALWLDPALGFHARHIEQRKNGGDWIEHGRSIASLPKFNSTFYPNEFLKERSQRIEAREWNRIGDSIVLIAMTAKEESRFSNNRTAVLDAHIRFSAVTLNPDFSKFDAFTIKTPIPNGTPVQVDDQPTIRFEWHDGRIVKPTFRAWGRGISPELYSSEDDQDTPYGSMSTPSRRRISCAAWGTSS